MSSINETEFAPLKENQKSEALIVNQPVYLFHVNVVELDGNRQISFKKEFPAGKIENENNIVPLTNTPLIGRFKNKDGEYQYLILGSDNNGKLYQVIPILQDKLGQQSLLTQDTLFEPTQEVYEFAFPALSLLAEYLVSQDQQLKDDWLKEFCDQTAINGNKSDDKSGDKFVQYTLTKAATKQFKQKAENPATTQELLYSDWYRDNIGTQAQLSGFAIGKSSLIYLHFNSDVLERQSVFVEKLTQPSSIYVYESEIEVKDGNAFCRLFLHDPEPNGRYRFRIVLDNDEYVVPDYFQTEQLNQTSQDIYEYQFIEDLDFSIATPFGQVAIVAGDPLSLEELLIDKFPSHLGHLAQFYSPGNDKIKSIPGAVGKPLAAVKALAKGAASITNGFINSSYADETNFDENNGSFGTDKSKLMFDISRNIWSAFDAGTDGQQLPDEVKKTVNTFLQFHDTADALSKWQGARQAASQTLSLKAFGQQFLENHFGPKITASHAAGWAVTHAHLDPKWYRPSVNASRAIAGVGTVIAADALYRNVSAYYKDVKNAGEAKQKLEKVSREYVKCSVLPSATTPELEGKLKAIGFNHFGLQGSQIVGHIGFGFNNTDLSPESAAPLGIIKDYLEENPAAWVKIEGYACDIGTREINDKVSLDRAHAVREALGLDDNSQRLILHAYGERKPLGSRREDNRAVTLELHTGLYGFDIYQGRTLYNMLERQRAIVEAFALTEDAKQRELLIAGFEAVLGTAGIHPAVAPLAFGYFAIKQSTKLLVSSADLMDSMFLDGVLAAGKESSNRTQTLNNVYRHERSLLQEYEVAAAEIPQDWHSQQFDSIEAARKFILPAEAKDGTETGANKGIAPVVLHQYLSRSIALTGLMLLLDYVNHRLENTDKLYQHKDALVEGFVNKYIYTDDWVVDYQGYSLFTNWLDIWRAKFRQKSVVGYYQKQLGASYQNSYAYGPYHQQFASVIRSARSQLRAGSFNTTFPVSVQYSSGETGIHALSSQLVPGKGKITPDDLDFESSGIYFSSYKETTWQKYDRSKHTLSPFDEVMVVLIATEEFSKTMPYAQVTMGYIRTDLWFNVEGPSFEQTFTHHKLSDFPSYVQRDVKSCFSPGDSADNSRLALQFKPFYYFGDTRFWGVKPIIKKGFAGLMGLFNRNLFNEMEYILFFGNNRKSQNQLEQWPIKLHLNHNVQREINDSSAPQYISKKDKVYYEDDLLVPAFYTHSSTEIKYPEMFNKASDAEIAVFVQVGNGEIRQFTNQSASYLNGSFDWAQSVRFYFVASMDQSYLATKVKPELEKMKKDWHSIWLTASLEGEKEKTLQTHCELRFAGMLKREKYTLSEKETDSDNSGSVADTYTVETTFNDTDVEGLNHVQSQIIKHIQTLKDSTELASLGIEVPKSDSENMMDYLPKERALFVGSYECCYVSPTGKKVNSIRPLGLKLDKLEQRFSQRYRFKEFFVRGSAQPVECFKKSQMFFAGPYEGLTNQVWQQTPSDNEEGSDQGLKARWNPMDKAAQEKELLKWMKEDTNWVYTAPIGE